MKIGPLEIEVRSKSVPPTLSPVLDSRGGWWPIIRESYPGAWQENVEVRAADALAYFAVYACTTLIAGDIAKCHCRVVEEKADDVWEPVEVAAYSPVLRKPNRYQNRIKFFEQWVVSKLTNGNTYVLKQRDNRQVVTAMYVLDPWRVRVLVAPDGAIYYSLAADNLAGLQALADSPINGSIVVPASEIIHDIQCALYHPLVGVSPIYACGIAAIQGLSIQAASNKFFANGSKPGGVLTAPGPIGQETADRIKAYWDSNFGGNNVGKVAVLGDGLKYEQMAETARDSQLIDQLKFSAETVCSAYHVQPYMIGIGNPPPYANVEPLLLAYFAQALQIQFESIELALDEGLGLAPGKIEGRRLGTEFDIGDLIWMDTNTRIKAGTDAIGGTLMSPNEARRKFLGLGRVSGGESLWSQQQNYTLAALSERDKNDPFKKIEPPPAPPPQNALPPGEDKPALPPAPEKGLEVDWAELLDLSVKAIEAEVSA